MRVGHDSEVVEPVVVTLKDFPGHERWHLRHDGRPQCRNTRTRDLLIEVERG